MEESKTISISKEHFNHVEGYVQEIADLEVDSFIEHAIRFTLDRKKEFEKEINLIIPAHGTCAES